MGNLTSTKNTAPGAGTITITVKDAQTLYTYLCMAFDQRINNEITNLVSDDKNWVLVSENGKEIKVLTARTLVEMLNIVHKYEELKEFYFAHLYIDSINRPTKEHLNISPESYIRCAKDTKNFLDLIDRLNAKEDR